MNTEQIKAARLAMGMHEPAADRIAELEAEVARLNNPLAPSDGVRATIARALSTTPSNPDGAVARVKDWVDSLLIDQSETWVQDIRETIRLALTNPAGEGGVQGALDRVPDGWSWSLGQMMGLPETMRYRCFLSDHNTPDGKATRHVCEDRATPVEAIEAAISAALAANGGEAG